MKKIAGSQEKKPEIQKTGGSKHIEKSSPTIKYFIYPLQYLLDNHGLSCE
jgi:hypothetical protein